MFTININMLGNTENNRIIENLKIAAFLLFYYLCIEVQSSYLS